MWILIVLLLLAVPSLAVAFVLIRFLTMFAKYRLNKHNYNHITHCHDGKKPCFLRQFSSEGECEEMVEEAFDPVNQQFYDLTHQGMGIGGANQVGICNADDIKMIFNQPEAFPKPEIYEKLKDMLGKGLVTTEGAEWKRQRRILTPAFHFSFLKGLFPIMTKNASLLVAKLSDQRGQVLDPFDTFSDVLLEILINSAIDDKIIDKTKVADTFRMMVEGGPSFFLSRFLFGTWDAYIPFDFATGPMKAKAIMDKMIAETLRKRRKLQKDTEEEEAKVQPTAPVNKYESGKDFVSLMIEGGMEDQDIIDNVISLLFPGRDSCASLLSSVVYYLCKHPEYQEKLYKQLSAGGFDHETIEVADLEKFPLLIQILKETGRFRPLTFNNVRTLLADTTMANGQTLPKGTVLNVMTMYVHQDPRYWDKPKEFYPERFSIRDEGNLKHPYAHIQYAAGPRNCIAQRFAQQQTQLLLGTIVSKFEIFGMGLENVKLDASLALKPKGLRVTFVPRN